MVSRFALIAAIVVAMAAISLRAVAQTVDVQSVLSAGQPEASMVAHPGSRSTAQAAAGACWTTNDLSIPPFEGGWPVTSTFFPGDLIAWATGPIRVTSENPGPHPITIHIENFAEVRGEYKHLARADMTASGEIFNESGAAFTDWWLNVSRRLPGFLKRMEGAKTVDWTMTISGYVEYTCEGRFVLDPLGPTASLLMNRGKSEAPFKTGMLIVDPKAVQSQGQAQLPPATRQL